MTSGRRAFIALCAVLFGCSSSASVSGSTTTTGGSSTSSGATTGGTNGGSSSGGASGGTTGSPGPDAGALVNILNGPLGFTVVFAGLLYDTLPDAGADLTTVDVRLTDGDESFALCPHGGAGDGGDGGVAAPSQNAVDIYLFNVPPVSTLGGNYSLLPTDAGPYALLYRTRRDLDAGTLFTLTAIDGMVQAQGAAGGVAGTFVATFASDGGEDMLSGSFNVPYCGAFSGG